AAKLAIWSLFALALAVATMPRPSDAQNSPQDYVSPHNAARGGRRPGLARSSVASRKGDCRLQHSDGPYGENLFWGSAGGGRGWMAAEAVRGWVEEKKDYSYASNSCAAGKVCGHYTQVVWRDSTSVGCVRVQCEAGRGVFIICNYEPRGNI
uniref:SCP domain-containing protein n=1 Tax=Oryza brachyantha TaxID=4533 RepID=J3L045_ORYBR